MRTVALLVALASAGLVACGGGSTSDAGSPEIVFTVNQAGWNEIWVMDPDGSARRRLTATASPEIDASGNDQPSWSPDGTSIAYVGTGEARREDENDRELYIMDADGRESRRLTENRFLDAEPAWSPDGDRLAFVRAIGWGTDAVRMGLYTIAADGSDETLVFEARPRPGSLVFVGAPAWSPSGDQIAFSLTTLGLSGPASGPIYVIGANGGNLRRVVSAGSQPAWSPNGRRLAFASMRDGFGRTCFHECGTAPEIYLVDVNGTGLRRLTQTRAADQSPTWSPDGSRILFVSDRSSPAAHRYELFVMDADGSSVERVSRNTPAADSWELEPDWQRGS